MITIVDARGTVDIVFLSAKSSFDEVVELIAKRTGASVPKRQVEELAVRAAQDYCAREKGTKTDAVRHIPVHPTLAAML